MASKVKGLPKKAAKKKNGYEMPKPLKLGDVIIDNQKGQWKVGVSIGVGGFGEIYSACKVGSNIKKVDDYPFVVKIVSYRQAKRSSGRLFHNIFKPDFRSQKRMARCSWRCISTCATLRKRTLTSSRRIASSRRWECLNSSQWVHMRSNR